MEKYSTAPPSYAEVTRPAAFASVTRPAVLRLGSPKDLASAAKVAGSSRVYGALRPTAEAVDAIVCSQSWPFYFPCWWPCLPCIMPCILNSRAALQNTLYVVTEDSVFITIEDHTPPCSCGCTTGRDSGEIHFDSITDVIVDTRGQGCAFCVTPAVVLSLVNRRIVLYVQDPEEVAHMIRELRRASKDRLIAATVIQQPVAVVPAHPVSQSKRILVTSWMNPTAYSIVNLSSDSQSDWDVFLSEIKEILQIPKEYGVKLVLQDCSAEVKRAEHLNDNDKVVVQF